MEYNNGYPDMTPADAERTIAYTRRLKDQLFDVVVAALARMEPAKLSWAVGKVAFPVSRRLPTPKGVVMGANFKGLTDKTVPVLRIDDPSGKLRAVLFGCACHNVAAGATNEVNGDYAGYAQTYLQKRFPGIQAMFMAGCGADANPYPLGTIDLAKSHGGELASEVSRVIEGQLEPVRGRLTTVLGEADLPLQELTRQDLRQYQSLPNYQARTATQMVALLDKGQKLLTSYRAPLSVWQFGDDLTLVALPAEPVAEYVPLLHRALGKNKLWIAGFNNDCFGYLPTAKVVSQGGHEAIGITLWAYGASVANLVGFFSPKVQDAVVELTRKLAAQAGRAPSPQSAQ